MRDVTLLYFDGCPNWETTADRLDQLASELNLQIRRVRVDNDDDVRRWNFRGSPTVMVDGRDPFATGDEPVGMACRIYQTPDGPAGSPTIDQLRTVLSWGGFVGVEFAQMFRRFGARVTIVQRSDRLLPREDPALSAVVVAAFRDEGIDVVVSTSCVAVDGGAGDIRVECEGAATTELAGSHLLVATGHTPNTDDLGIEHLDLEVDANGFVPVNDRLRTGAEGVWALGDLRGHDMFTHTARDDADVVYRTLFEDQERTIADRIVPHAVFVDPEIASVGLTRQQTLDTGHDVAVGTQEFTGVAKAKATGDTLGHITFVTDAATDQILGCHIAGPDAGNLIHEAVIAMAAGLPARTIADTIHIHPTLAEGVNAAAGGVHRPSTDETDRQELSRRV